jgi:hypothetical protein
MRSAYSPIIQIMLALAWEEYRKGGGETKKRRMRRKSEGRERNIRRGDS